MRILRSILAGGAGLAALAAAGPAAAQYGYGYSPYGYNAYGYNAYAGVNSSVAAQQCTAAVQNRLYTRTGLSGILGALVGAYGAQPRVLSITSVQPRAYGTMRVRGLANSGRFYNNYGVGYYGALGAGYAADLSFRCDVDARGYVRNVDINRRY
jgi:hypothetical protein